MNQTNKEYFKELSKKYGTPFYKIKSNWLEYVKTCTRINRTKSRDDFEIQYEERNKK